MSKDILRTIHVHVKNEGATVYQLLVREKGVHPKIHELGQIHKRVALNCLDNFVDHYRHIGGEAEVILEEVKEVHTVKVCKIIPQLG